MARVFGSPLESLRTRAWRQFPSFPVLADPDDTAHNLYGTGNILLAACGGQTSGGSGGGGG
ncbi:MAG: hypothetical protein RQ868_10635, partial [Meiothermus sp.]|nr:hypothetical protein [Meiothermus sp.]